MAGKIVVPGEVIGKGAKHGINAYSDGESMRSEVVGLADERGGKVIALKGQYMPLLDDWVIGVVSGVKHAGADIEIKAPYRAFISTKMSRVDFQLGEVVGAKVDVIDEARNIDLTEPRKLVGGEILEISAVKVPRVIGRKNSMIDLLAQGTGSEILVGRNGRIWIKGGEAALAVKAILMIERDAHTSGLTDRIMEFLKRESKK